METLIAYNDAGINQRILEARKKNDEVDTTNLNMFLTITTSPTTRVRSTDRLLFQKTDVDETAIPADPLIDIQPMDQ